MQFSKTLSLILALAAGTSANLSAHQLVDVDQIATMKAESFADCAAYEIVSGRVQAGSTDAWNMTLPADVLSILQLRGDGDTDLDLYLYDENGNLIDFDESLDDRGVVSVTPYWTGKFVVRIVNRGYVYNDYTLQLL